MGKYLLEGVFSMVLGDMAHYPETYKYLQRVINKGSVSVTRSLILDKLRISV